MIKERQGQLETANTVFLLFDLTFGKLIYPYKLLSQVCSTQILYVTLQICDIYNVNIFIRLLLIYHFN